MAELWPHPADAPTSEGTTMLATVWRDSISAPVHFTSITRKQATAIWHKARRLDMRTSRKGRHGGMIGRSALAVLSVLIFDFLDYSSGRLDPSHAAIARKARMCERTVATALQKLKILGILNWLRRCHEERGPWGVRFKQDTNAYVITAPSILTMDDPPPPEPHEWGAVPCLPDAMTQAVEAMRNGDRRTMLAALEADLGDEVAQLWASFYREVDRREAKKSSDLPD
jgi:hypothetical protein